MRFIEKEIKENITCDECGGVVAEEGKLCETCEAVAMNEEVITLTEDVMVNDIILLEKGDKIKVLAEESEELEEELEEEKSEEEGEE